MVQACKLEMDSTVLLMHLSHTLKTNITAGRIILLTHQSTQIQLRLILLFHVLQLDHHQQLRRFNLMVNPLRIQRIQRNSQLVKRNQLRRKLMLKLTPRKQLIQLKEHPLLLKQQLQHQKEKMVILKNQLKRPRVNNQKKNKLRKMMKQRLQMLKNLVRTKKLKQLKLKLPKKEKMALQCSITGTEKIIPTISFLFQVLRVVLHHSHIAQTWSTEPSCGSTTKSSQPSHTLQLVTTATKTGHEIHLIK